MLLRKTYEFDKLFTESVNSTASTLETLSDELDATSTFHDVMKEGNIAFYGLINATLSWEKWDNYDHLLEMVADYDEESKLLAACNDTQRKLVMCLGRGGCTKANFEIIYEGSMGLRGDFSRLMSSGVNIGSGKAGVYIVGRRLSEHRLRLRESEELVRSGGKV